MTKDEMADTNRLETAADWMLRLRDPGASEQEIVRWVEWCELDPRHRQAFDRVEKLWDVSGALAGEVRNGELLDVSGATTSNKVTAAWSNFCAGLAVHRRGMAMGAIGAALVIAAAGWLLRGSFPGAPNLVTIASTEPVHKALLADGSTVELAARSSVAVRYSRSERVLELQSGEAYFSVAHNPGRPFVVAAGAFRIRAVGTSFDVRRADDWVVTTVVNGTVDVYATAGSSAPPFRISAGRQVRWRMGDKDPVVIAIDPASALAWREGRLEYSDEPLGSVIADLNRYSRRPVRIEGDALKLTRFSGTVLTSATDEWLRALPAGFPVEVNPQDGVDVIRLRRGNEK